MRPIRLLHRLAACAAVIALAAWSLPARADLEQLRRSGTLKVAVYKDFAPFSTSDGGIDVDLATALAQRLGLRVSLLPFDAGENVEDDLRNMVWKGHYLGYGPADVLLHVPVDRVLMEQSRKVKIFGPYYRDQVRLVRNVARIPECPTLDCLDGRTIGVEKVSISAMVVLGEQGGRFRERVRIFDTPRQALDALKAGQLDAVLANRSEIESAVGKDPAFATSEALFPRLPRQGWVVGLAVKDENVELARALQEALNAMQDSGELARIFAAHGVTAVRP